MAQTIIQADTGLAGAESPLSVDDAVRAALSRPSEIRSFNEDDMEGPRGIAALDALATAPAP